MDSTKQPPEQPMDHMVDIRSIFNSGNVNVKKGGDGGESADASEEGEKRKGEVGIGAQTMLLPNLWLRVPSTRWRSVEGFLWTHGHLIAVLNAATAYVSERTMRLWWVQHVIPLQRRPSSSRPTDDLAEKVRFEIRVGRVRMTELEKVPLLLEKLTDAERRFVLDMQLTNTASDSETVVEDPSSIHPDAVLVKSFSVGPFVPHFFSKLSPLINAVLRATSQRQKTAGLDGLSTNFLVGDNKSNTVYRFFFQKRAAAQAPKKRQKGRRKKYDALDESEDIIVLRWAPNRKKEQWMVEVADTDITSAISPGIADLGRKSTVENTLDLQLAVRRIRRTQDLDFRLRLLAQEIFLALVKKAGNGAHDMRLTLHRLHLSHDARSAADEYVVLGVSTQHTTQTAVIGSHDPEVTIEGRVCERTFSATNAPKGHREPQSALRKKAKTSVAGTPRVKVELEQHFQRTIYTSLSSAKDAYWVAESVASEQLFYTCNAIDAALLTFRSGREEPTTRLEGERALKGRATQHGNDSDYVQRLEKSEKPRTDRLTHQRECNLSDHAGEDNAGTNYVDLSNTLVACVCNAVRDLCNISRTTSTIWPKRNISMWMLPRFVRHADHSFAPNNLSARPNIRNLYRRSKKDGSLDQDKQMSLCAQEMILVPRPRVAAQGEAGTYEMELVCDTTGKWLRAVGIKRAEMRIDLPHAFECNEKVRQWLCDAYSLNSKTPTPERGTSSDGADKLCVSVGVTYHPASHSVLRWLQTNLAALSGSQPCDVITAIAVTAQSTIYIRLDEEDARKSGVRLISARQADLELQRWRSVINSGSYGTSTKNVGRNEGTAGHFASLSIFSPKDADSNDAQPLLQLYAMSEQEFYRTIFAEVASADHFSLVVKTVRSVCREIYNKRYSFQRPIGDLSVPTCLFPPNDEEDRGRKRSTKHFLEGDSEVSSTPGISQLYIAWDSMYSVSLGDVGTLATRAKKLQYRQLRDRTLYHISYTSPTHTTTEVGKLFSFLSILPSHGVPGVTATDVKGAVLIALLESAELLARRCQNIGEARVTTDSEKQDLSRVCAVWSMSSAIQCTKVLREVSAPLAAKEGQDDCVDWPRRDALSYALVEAALASDTTELHHSALRDIRLWTEGLRLQGILSLSDIEAASDNSQLQLLLRKARVPLALAPLLVQQTQKASKRDPTTLVPCDTSLSMVSRALLHLERCTLVPVALSRETLVDFPEANVGKSDLVLLSSVTADEEAMRECLEFAEGVGSCVFDVNGVWVLPMPSDAALGFGIPLASSTHLALALNTQFTHLRTSSGTAVVLKRMDDLRSMMWRSPSKFEMTLVEGAKHYVTPRVGEPLFQSGRLVTWYQRQSALLLTSKVLAKGLLRRVSKLVLKKGVK